jgi:hypothetical protein
MIRRREDHSKAGMFPGTNTSMSLDRGDFVEGRGRLSS